MYTGWCACCSKGAAQRFDTAPPAFNRRNTMFDIVTIEPDDSVVAKAVKAMISGNALISVPNDGYLCWRWSGTQARIH